MSDQQVSERIVSGLAKIGMVLKQQAWQAAGPRGLTPTQSQVLTVLYARPECGLRLSVLASSLAITPATASEAVSALEKKGLVRKQRDCRDFRALAIALTPQGRREAARLSEWPDFLLAAVDALTPAEQEVLLLALVKMVRFLQNLGRIPLARMCVNCTYFTPHRYADPERPHHCGFVNAPFGARQLRLDCQDFQPAPVPVQDSNLRVLSLHPGKFLEVNCGNNS